MSLPGQPGRSVQLHICDGQLEGAPGARRDQRTSQQNPALLAAVQHFGQPADSGGDVDLQGEEVRN